jgi:CRP-like cAMP-binding protein
MNKNVVFSGKLDFLNLGELLQILGTNNSSGILRITSKYAESPGLIYVNNGNTVDASNGSLSSVDALYSLFGWIDGEFEFCMEDVDKKNVINKNRMEIILDGTRMVDDGKIEKLGPVSFKEKSETDQEKKALLPLVKGPIVDYMYVIDEEEFFEGDEIVFEGNYGNWMWVILDGIVDITKETPKGTLNLISLSNGSFVGSIASFLSEGNVRSATVVARGHVQLGMLDSQRLSGEFAKMSSELRSVVKSLDKRLKQVSNNAIDLYMNKNYFDKFIKNKKVVIKQGKSEDRAFTIAKGDVVIARKTDKGFVPLSNIGKGDYFGNIPFINMGHEPHNAFVFSSKDLKLNPIDLKKLQQEHDSLSSTFKNIIENIATCISVTTLLASRFQEKIVKKK